MARRSKRGSYRLGQAFGISVYVHVTFLLLLAFLAILPLIQGEGLETSLRFTVLMLCLFSCVILHEFGHALTARQFGIRTRDITLLPFGGLASLERLPDEPLQEMLVAVAGPAVNVVIATLLYLLIEALGMGPRVMDPVDAPLLVQLMWVNLTLAIFNLLPAFPMDGGRVLRALLALKLRADRATHYAARVGQLMAIGFAILGVMVNPMLVLIAIFVFVSAGAENKSQKVRTQLEGARVGDAMAVRFTVFEASTVLSSALRGLLEGPQQAFPVLFSDRVVGMVSREELVEALAQHQDDVSLWMVMRRDLEVIHPEMTLHEVLLRMQNGGFSALPVMVEDRLVGMLTLEGVRSLAMIRQASSRNPGRPVVVAGPRPRSLEEGRG